MSHRRQFLKEAAAAAGVVFTNCSLLERRLTAQSSAARRQVMVGGRRIRTIDIHAHVIVPDATALMGVKTAPDNASVIASDNSTTADRFRTMDQWGTDMQALSINPTWYATERDVATKVIQV